MTERRAMKMGKLICKCRHRKEIHRPECQGVVGRFFDCCECREFFATNPPRKSKGKEKAR